MSKSDSFVSVTIVTGDAHVPVVAALQTLQPYLAAHFVDYEILVLDHSGSALLKSRVSDLLHELPGIRFLELAYRVADDVAVAAALENAIGDFVVLWTPGRDPAGVIGPLVERCRKGADIVVGVAPGEASWAYHGVRPLVGRLLRSIGYDLPRNATTLRCLSRRAVNAVTRAGRFHHQLYVRIQKTGFPSEPMSYTLAETASRKRLSHGIKDGARLLVFNSTRPLRWMGAIGVSASLLSTLAAVALTIWRADGGAPEFVPPLLASLICFLFTVMFAMLAFFGEYLGRLLDEEGESNLYSVIQEKNSSVMINENRENVLVESHVGNTQSTGEGSYA